MALKSVANAERGDGVDVEELIEQLEKLLERLKVMYEQYFMGLQKLAPAQLHTEAERRIRDLMQAQIRNTALKYRFASLQQKFGSYNSYWRRTLKEIEQGRYVRNLARLGRQAVRTGAEIPEEILAAMPKRMREQVIRDREAALAIAKRRGGASEVAAEVGPSAASGARQAAPGQRDAQGNFVLNANELGDVDFDSMFAALGADDGHADNEWGGAATDPNASGLAGRQPGKPPTPAPGPGSGGVVAAAAPSNEANSGAVGGTVRGVIPGLRLPGAPQPAARAVPVPPVPGPGAPPASRRPGAAGPSMPPPLPPRASAGLSMPPPIPSRSGAGSTIAPGALRPTPPAGVPAVRAAPTPSAGVPAVRAVPTPPAGVPAVRAMPTPPAGVPAVGATSRAATNAGSPRAATAAVAATAASRPSSPALKPPSGMSDNDVKKLYDSYVAARELIGEKSDATTYAKLMKTIHQQAPKIMEQYKSAGVEFGVVVKNNQVILKAKPK